MAQVKLRRGRTIATARIEIEIPAGMLHYVREALRTGLYGFNEEAAIERMLGDQVRHLIDTGWIARVRSFSKMGVPQ